jgi:hypothetical protein
MGELETVCFPFGPQQQAPGLVALTQAAEAEGQAQVGQSQPHQREESGAVALVDTTAALWQAQQAQQIQAAGLEAAEKTKARPGFLAALALSFCVTLAQHAHSAEQS